MVLVFSVLGCCDSNKRRTFAPLHLFSQFTDAQDSAQLLVDWADSLVSENENEPQEAEETPLVVRRRPNPAPASSQGPPKRPRISLDSSQAGRQERRGKRVDEFVEMQNKRTEYFEQRLELDRRRLEAEDKARQDDRAAQKELKRADIVLALIGQEKTPAEIQQYLALLNM